MKCATRQMSKKSAHRASFRRRNVKGGFMLFACPKKKWKHGVCVGGMKLYERVRTSVNRCPSGWQKV